MEISKELLIKDLKELDSIDKLFCFFTSEQGHAEYGKEAKQYYDKLNWNQSSCYDVINSFWITFSYAMHVKYKEAYPIMKAGNVGIYKRHYKNFDSFPEKYFKENSEEKKQVTTLCKDYPNVNKLAELCHTIANFIPCPQAFNSTKGLLEDVRDYFPLMIDKIQQCVDEKSDLKYKYSQEVKVVTNQEVKEWHSFFIDNQDKYCLNMYYKVDDVNGEKRISGISFFKGQNLSNPYPKNEDEVKECLSDMVEKIENRAKLLFDKYITEKSKSNT